MLCGMAILCVIAIHTYEPSIEGWINLTNFGVRQILNCAVPLFFAMSGFFIYKKALANKQAVLQFWKHQIPKVYVPTFLWSLPLFFMAIIKGKDPIYQSLNLLICCFSVYYFIAVAIQYYLLLPALERFKSADLMVNLSVFISLLSIMIVTYFNIIPDAHLPLIIYAGCSLLWLMFFVIGAILFLMSAKVEHFVMNHRQNTLSRLLEYLGSVSFIIYLIHLYVKKLILPHTSIINDFWLTRWLLVCLLSMVFVQVMNRLIPTKLKYYLGIYDQHHR